MPRLLQVSTAPNPEGGLCHLHFLGQSGTKSPLGQSLVSLQCPGCHC